MFLSDYIKENGITQKQFADMCGLSEAGICRLVNGKRFPSPATIYIINQITEGQVGAEDFFKQAIGEK